MFFAPHFFLFSLLSIISTIHILSATASLYFGAVVLVNKKGDKKHRRIGRYYFIAMILCNLSSLCIYNAFEKWFFPHTLAVITLILLLLGYGVLFLKSFFYKYPIHFTCMTGTYYLLIGGGINEAFIHIPLLQPYFGNSSLFKLAHFITILLFCVLLFVFWIKNFTQKKKT